MTFIENFNLNISRPHKLKFLHYLYFIVDPPRPSAYSAAIHFFLGTTVVLSPVLKNMPHPPLTEYLWEKDGQRVGSRYTTTQQGSLKIRSVQSQDKGTYTFIGDNGYGRTVQQFDVAGNFIGKCMYFKTITYSCNG